MEAVDENMSRATMLGIWPGERSENLLELSNSYGAAPPVWEALAKEFLNIHRSYEHPNKGWMQRIDEVFALWNRQDVPLSLRAVLLMTCDYAYVLQKDYVRAAKDILFFMERYPNLDCSEEYPTTHGTRAWHWNTIAWLYEGKLNVKPDCPAIGMWCTSVTSNPFGSTWKEVEEDGKFDDVEVPFDWSTAYNLYDLLDSLTK